LIRSSMRRMVSAASVANCKTQATSTVRQDRLEKTCGARDLRKAHRQDQSSQRSSWCALNLAQLAEQMPRQCTRLRNAAA
jgi:hypothetical protein